MQSLISFFILGMRIKDNISQKLYNEVKIIVYQDYGLSLC